jgi:type VI protein secretion system component VasF
VLRRAKVRVSAELSPHGRRHEIAKPQRRGKIVVPLWLTAVVSVAAIVGAWALLFVGNLAEVHGVIAMVQSLIN